MKLFGLLLLVPSIALFSANYGAVEACSNSAGDVDALKGAVDPLAGGGKPTPAPAPSTTTTAPFTNTPITCGSGSIPSGVSPGIVGGLDAADGQFPWQAWLIVQNSWRCGGVLIHEKWVITAAHCCPDKGSQKTTNTTIQVNLGSLNREDGSWEYSQFSKGFAIYPYWNSNLINGDYCLVELATKVRFTSKTKPICLAASVDLECQPNDIAIVSGWGRLSTNGALPTYLQYAAVPIVSNPVCQQSYVGSPIDVPNSLEICAGGDAGKGICNGDSGGPLICYKLGAYYLSGLSSYGRSAGCGLDGIPNVFSRIRPVVDLWIRTFVPNV